jgi:hypothetical protein
MFLEYDWTSNCYRPRLGHLFIAVREERSWPTLNEAKVALAAAGLELGKKTDSRSWAIELTAATRAQWSSLRGGRVTP